MSMSRNAGLSSRFARFWMALLLLTVGVGCGYNEVIERDEQVKAAWAEVENQYQRRADVVPNLVRVVKGAADFEKGTLEAVVEARSKVGSMQVDSSIVAQAVRAGPGPALLRALAPARGQ